jgi:diadenosine tetraphosphate (Ap4A) HIT family hydrolase
MNYDSNNIFAKILLGSTPCQKIYENDKVLAFKDIYPKAKVHVLVIPKIPVSSFEVFAKENTLLVGEFFQSVNFIATEVLNLKENFKLVINNGEKGGQEIFHFHVHILSN